MKIKTKFNIGDTVWFENVGVVNKGKIVHIETNNNSMNTIIYTVNRNDRQYKEEWDYRNMRLMHYRCEHYERVVTTFNEDEIGETKEALMKTLRRKELLRHEKKLDWIARL